MMAYEFMTKQQQLDEFDFFSRETKDKVKEVVDMLKDPKTQLSALLNGSVLGCLYDITRWLL